MSRTNWLCVGTERPGRGVLHRAEHILGGSCDRAAIAYCGARLTDSWWDSHGDWFRTATRCPHCFRLWNTGAPRPQWTDRDPLLWAWRETQRQNLEGA